MKANLAMIGGGLIGGLIAAGPAAAQIPESPGPPPGEPSVVPVLIAAGLVALICMAAMKTAKRSHQD